MEEIPRVAISSQLHGTVKLVASYRKMTIAQYVTDALNLALRMDADKYDLMKPIIDKLEVK